MDELSLCLNYEVQRIITEIESTTCSNPFNSERLHQAQLKAVTNDRFYRSSMQLSSGAGNTKPSLVDGPEVNCLST